MAGVPPPPDLSPSLATGGRPQPKTNVKGADVKKGIKRAAADGDDRAQSDDEGEDNGVGGANKKGRGRPAKIPRMQQEMAELKARLESAENKLKLLAEAKLASMATCVVCHDATALPLRVCKAKSEHIACLDCALMLTGSAFVVVDHGLPDSWTVKPYINGRGRGSGGGLTWRCPSCQHESTVTSFSDFVYGREFGLLSTSQYEELSSLAQETKRLSSISEGLTTAEHIRREFSRPDRRFPCPLGFDPDFSHDARPRACKMSFCLSYTAMQDATDSGHKDNKTEFFLTLYTSALRQHAKTECVTLVGSCLSCSEIRHGVPACEVADHKTHHNSVDKFWKMANAAIADILLSYQNRAQHPPLNRSLLPKYQVVLDKLLDAHAELMILMESGQREEFQNRLLVITKQIASKKNILHECPDCTQIIEAYCKNGLWWNLNGRRLAFLGPAAPRPAAAAPAPLPAAPRPAAAAPAPLPAAPAPSAPAPLPAAPAPSASAPVPAALAAAAAAAAPAFPAGAPAPAAPAPAGQDPVPAPMALAATEPPASPAPLADASSAHLMDVD